MYGGSSAKNGRAESERTDIYVYYKMERCKRLRSMSVENAFYRKYAEKKVLNENGSS